MSANQANHWLVELLHRDGTVLQRVAFTGAPLGIGRSLDNDVIVDDPHCAAHHAQLRLDSDGQVRLYDLGTKNGIRTPKRFGRSQHHAVSLVLDGTRWQLGMSTVRIRHIHAELAPELPLSTTLVWPYALLVLMAVLACEGWDIWLRDVNPQQVPTYLVQLSGLAAGLAAWSAVYALLGRVLGGGDRFFTHLFIVGCAYLGAYFLDVALEQLAFSFYWLWPLRVGKYVLIVALALTVRAHLRVADPKHWPITRWGVVLATVLAIAVPLGQTWISSKRLTHVQVVDVNKHPATLVTPPVAVADFMRDTIALQQRADAQAQLHDNDEED